MGLRLTLAPAPAPALTLTACYSPDLNPDQAGEHGQHCRFCGFESDGVKYPPCSTSGHPATSPPSAKGAASSKGKAASTLTTSFLMQPSSTLSGAPTRPVLPMARKHGHSPSWRG